MTQTPAAFAGPTRAAILLTLSLVCVARAGAQAPAAPVPDEGTPIASPAVRQACARCHAVDDQGRMTRISYRRTTPEGWQQTIRRMVLLNALTIETEAARQVVAYLSNRLGLAPEEARAAAFEAERRMIDYKYEASRDIEETCTKCHSMGRILSERRTKEEWELLLAMHRGYYPLVDTQAFLSNRALREDEKHPMDRAIAHLAEAFPFKTAAWTEWAATMRSPRLEGSWLLSGWQRGQGPIVGRVTVRVTPGQQEQFTTEATYQFLRSGEQVRRTGEAIVYTGFQWRGRSTIGGEGLDLREVMFVERDWQTIDGRWFAGGYDEIGSDVTLRRIGTGPLLAAVHPPALRQGVAEARLDIYGANLTVSPQAIDLGPGIAVTRVVDSAPDRLTLDVRVAADAAVGARDLFVGGATMTRGLAVYDRIDAIKVVPETGMARVGGVVFPKQFEQFEARAYQRGPDDKPGTDDDLYLGIVDAAWRLEEYAATLDDDDIEFVGRLDEHGLFTPAEDGPNPARRNNANNIGDVWVVASFRPDGAAADSPPLRARAHLLVTVPLYMRWEPWSMTP